MTPKHIAAVAAVLLVGSAATSSPRPDSGTILLTGSYNAGGSPGTFRTVMDAGGGRWRTDVVTGPLAEESGFDGSPWLRHDGRLTAIDMEGSVRDARARSLVMRRAWADPAIAAYARFGADRRTVSMAAPGASAFTARLDADGNPVDVTIDGDDGPQRIELSDWRRSANAGWVAWRRQETDAGGQQTTFTVATVAAADPASLRRPASDRRDAIPGGASRTPFEFVEGDRGHIVVPARIGGMAAKLIFDTGAANYLTPHTAAAYGLAVGGGLSIGGVGGESFPGGFTRVPSIAIGRATLVSTVSIVAPLPSGATDPRPGLSIQGLTGGEFLTAFTTTIDYARRTITFEQPRRRDRLPGAMPFRTDGIGIFVQARVEGRPGWFRLDTGDAGMITLFAPFARANGLDRGGTAVVRQGQVGGDLNTRAVTFRSVELGGVALPATPGEVSEQTAGAFASKTIAGNLGAGLLHGRRITIDYATRTVAISAPARSR